MKHLFLLPFINYTRGYSNSLSWWEKIPLCRGVRLINVEGLKGKNNIRKSPLFCNDGNFYNGGTGPSPLESTDWQQCRWNATSSPRATWRDGTSRQQTLSSILPKQAKVQSEFNQIFKCKFWLTEDRGERSLRPFTVKSL